ncbi:hypothetical protein [Neobacillus sp. DY30]|uniref:hypothetical protein n=1 Tax=Neobacillus sp. DY30 TaxID=3047871 RepID=UPI0024BF4D8E|nr:hypothetical protein [Neobacillus sp. DY30]WHY00482.1 hypothetical protein QNH29_28850 [Neobacillus sp. DY30]
MPNSLIFIGERPSQMEMHIKGKPDFYDALLLSKNPSSHLSYHSIPLHQSSVTIHIRENKSQFNCYRQSLQLIEGERPLSEKDAYDIFTNFAIIDDNKVAFIMVSGRNRIRLREKAQPRDLYAYEIVEV